MDSITYMEELRLERIARSKAWFLENPDHHLVKEILGELNLAVITPEQLDIIATVYAHSYWMGYHNV